MHLPPTVKEVLAGYLISPYLADIYAYHAQNKFSHTKAAIRKVETVPEIYILLDSLLFKLITTPREGPALLAILKTCAYKIILSCHLCMFEGHQGVIKTYLTKEINSLYLI